MKVFALAALLVLSAQGPPTMAQGPSTMDHMVFIDGRTFTMGTDPAQVDALMARFGTKRREIFSPEQPSRRVTVASFWLDRTEVTNAAFEAFVAADPRWARGAQLPVGEGDLPAAFVSWDAAAAYCAWAGKRLPTEAEWELAAGGGGAAEFPWGDGRPDPARANWSASGIGRPVPVASYPAVRGIYDMAGNVWEFVADAWTDSYDAKTTSEMRKVIRGGSFGGAPVNLRVRYRDSHPANNPGPHVGFRCARDASVTFRYVSAWQ